VSFAGHNKTTSKFAILACLAVLTALVCCPWKTRAERLDDLAPWGYVSDFAGALSHDTRVQLTKLCVEVDDRTHAQIAVVTIHSTAGIPIEQFANQMYERWGIGYKPENRGALVLLAVNDRRYWVEVGYGLEPILPDGKVGGFGREMVPMLKQGDYNRATLFLTGEVARVIAADRHVALASQPDVQLESRSGTNFGGSSATTIVVLVLVLLAFGGLAVLVLPALLASQVGRFGRGGWGSMGGPWMGGASWGGFGGGGGGGFGGFGGGISGGGGAGGSW
jgi:uncharacterized protein